MKFYATLYFNGATTGLFSYSNTIEFTFTANSFQDAIKSYSSYDKSFCIKIDGGYKVINTSSVKYIDIIDEQTYIKQKEAVKALDNNKTESEDTDRATEQKPVMSKPDENLCDINCIETTTNIDASVTSKSLADAIEENNVSAKKRKYTRKDTNVENPVT